MGGCVEDYGLYYLYLGQNQLLPKWWSNLRQSCSKVGTVCSTSETALTISYPYV